MLFTSRRLVTSSAASWWSTAPQHCWPGMKRALLTSRHLAFDSRCLLVGAYILLVQAGCHVAGGCKAWVHSKQMLQLAHQVTMVARSGCAGGTDVRGLRAHLSAAALSAARQQAAGGELCRLLPQA